MKEIMLITTKGCLGCDIMRKSIVSALSSTRKKDIKFTELDIEDIDKKTRSRLGLRDFPTTIFKKNNRTTRREVGTRPAIVVLRWIDIDFK